MDRDYTKASTAREMKFGNQMSEVLGMLKSIDGKVGVVDTPAIVADISRWAQADNTRPRDPSQTRAAENIRILVESGQHMSLDGLAEEVRHLLGGGSSLDGIRVEIKMGLWNPDWKPETSGDFSTTTTSLDIDVVSAARAAAARLRFESLGAREAAVADSILQTYSWIFDRPTTSPGAGQSTPSPAVDQSRCSFPDWLEDPAQPVYWVTGKPGSGKSTMMKHILRNPALKVHLEKWAGGSEILIATYYAWHAGTVTLQKSFQGLKRTVLHQALDRYPNLVSALAPRVWTYHTIIQPIINDAPTLQDWEVDESFEALLSLARKGLCLVIFIDGLDEFDVQPKEVVSLVDSITSTTRQGAKIKVCVASRPWPQFSDAYGDLSKVEMELRNDDDMKTFRDEKISKCKALDELKLAHPAETTDLLNEVIQKANGVFIWLRIVVEALVEDATEGSGIRALRDLLDSLPDDIQKLYDAIWDRIPEDSRKRGALLLRMANMWTVTWDEAWLADEYPFSDPTFKIADATFDADHLNIERLVKRKLATHTRGLLEAGPKRQVDFTHRTAHDWAHTHDVREKLEHLTSDHCDLHLLIVQIMTVKLTCHEICPSTYHMFWNDLVLQAFPGASKATLRHDQDESLLVQALDEFDTRAGLLLERIESRSQTSPLAPIRDPTTTHWASIDYGDDGNPNPPNPNPTRWRNNTFIGLAAQFAILPYIRAKANENPAVLVQKGTPQTVGIFESAVLGYPFYAHRGRKESDLTVREEVMIWDNPRGGARLKTVQYLLDQGVEEKHAFLRYNSPGGQWICYNLLNFIKGREKLYRKSGYQNTDQNKYYQEVIKHLGRSGPGGVWRSAKGRVVSTSERGWRRVKVGVAKKWRRTRKVETS